MSKDWKGEYRRTVDEYGSESWWTVGRFIKWIVLPLFVLGIVFSILSYTLGWFGEAAKTQAILTATAKGEAAKVGEKMMAEANGTELMAKALKQMDERGQLIIILDRLPAIMDKGGDALAKIGEAIFKSVAAPLGNIDSLHIVDIGGNGKGIGQLSTLVPKIVFEFFTACKAQGIDLTPIIGKLGIDAAGLEKLIGQISPMVNASTPKGEGKES
ncbi:MAG: hypothetical protein Q7K54_05210 [Candidatus Parcubacteria bacterium]|nr:hypothetical protein [Candidatus Parcubacteria bacterium]